LAFWLLIAAHNSRSRKVYPTVHNGQLLWGPLLEGFNWTDAQPIAAFKRSQNYAKCSSFPNSPHCI